MVDAVLGFCQFDVEPGEISRNVKRVERALREFGDRGCRLVLLPEMWSCGFFYSALREMAGETPGIIERLQELAEELDLVVIGSLPELEGDCVYNTLSVIDSDGRLAGSYRKIHLFTFAEEQLYFTRGRAPLVCDTSVGRIGAMICYDLRFPELARRLALDGAEILCVPALWPDVRIGHWSLLLRARAVENQLFVMGCNGTGREGRLQYGGHSAIVSPLGTVLGEGGAKEETIAARAAPEEMIAYREQMRCFEDRLPGIYGID